MLKKAIKTLSNDSALLISITIIIALSIIFYDQPQIAMWIGFAIAAYSAIANDSIQTLGTFLTSNKNTKWWILWGFLSFIMVAVHVYGFIIDNGDVAYGRLARIPEVQSFNFIQLLAPVILIILTRLKMPVSTTFLLLSVFSSKETIQAMLEKTAIGYVLAFVVAIIVWTFVNLSFVKKIIFGKSYNKKLWRILQWISTAFLWASWLIQDTANIAVFLPRQLDLIQLLMFLTTLVILLGILMYIKGGKIQEIVTEKHDIVDVRSATIIDFTLAILLFYFKTMNNIPMSTTWVFLGLLAGREFALTRLSTNNLTYRKTLKLVLKDIFFATIGLIISIAIVFLMKQGS